MTFPTLFEVLPIFTDSTKCIEFLLEERLLRDQPSCGNCRKNTFRSNTFWRCSSRSHNWKKTIFADSIFNDSRVSPGEVLLMGYLWLSKASHSTIVMITGRTPKTVTKFTNLFRDMVGLEIAETRAPIGGNNVIVEVDESKFGKRKYHRGHRVEGVWIVGGVERTEERRFFAEAVEHRDAATLVDVVRRNVLPGSTVHSDLWRAYNAITSELDLEHRTVNHSRHFVDPETGVHTNTIEGMWHGMKIGIPERKRNLGRVENHISEFIWRKQNEGRLWTAFLECLRHSQYS